MKQIYFAALLCLGASAFAQEVQFDYDRSADFGVYKTYAWVDRLPVAPGDQLLDKDIKRAVDDQLAGKRLRRVESGGDLHISYRGAISQEKEYEHLGPGPLWWGDGRVTTSTIDVGKLAIEIFDPASSELVWRGFVSKTLDLSRDPDKNYRNLEKAMAKLFKNYPPGAGKKR